MAYNAPAAIRGCCRIKNRPHKHKRIFKIMTDILKNAELQQSCITAVISRFNSNSKVIEITETELRGLIFWATVGIEKSRGGSYFSIVEFIKDNYKFMTHQKARYKKLVFGSRLENGL